MLFTYAFLLERVARSVTILFVSTPGGAPLTITNKSVIGTISARSLIQIFLKYQPQLAKVGARLLSDQDRIDEPAPIPDPQFLQRIVGEYTMMTNYRHLSQREVREWFGPLLSTRIVDIAMDAPDLREIRRALEAGEDFVILVDRERFRSVVDLCYFTRGVTRMAVAEIQRGKS